MQPAAQSLAQTFAERFLTIAALIEEIAGGHGELLLIVAAVEDKVDVVLNPGAGFGCPEFIE